MTRERDIERVLDAWFEPGPTEMPDRLFDDVLARVDRLPQRRIPLTLRLLPMDSRIRWLALAAAVLVVAVAGLSLINRPSGPGTSPTPSTSATPGATGPVPAELIGRWMSGPRTVPGINEFAGTTLVFQERTVAITQSNDGTARRLVSEASSEPGGPVFDVVSGVPPGGCLSGDAGSYSWTLSPGGRVLTITANSDSCALRQDAFAGTWWKTTCRNTDVYCLGDVEAGTYASQYIETRGPGGDAWQPRFGALRYTVPGGWANADDWPSTFSLMPQREYDTYDPSTCGEVCPDAINVLARPSAAGQANGCESQAEPGVGRTATDLVNWLTSHPGLVTSTEPVTVGGRAATAVDIAVAESWNGTCGEPPLVGVPLLTEVGGWHWAIFSFDRYRVIPVDIGDGETVVIIVDTRDAGTFDAFVAEAMPVIESFDFE